VGRELENRWGYRLCSFQEGKWASCLSPSSGLGFHKNVCLNDEWQVDLHVVAGHW